MNEFEQAQFENYLREFRPRKPKDLPETRPEFSWRRYTAAAVLVAACCCSGWFALRHSQKVSYTVTRLSGGQEVPNSTIGWAQLALENPEAFEVVADEQAQTILQKFDSARSSLRALAKE